MIHSAVMGTGEFGSVKRHTKLPLDSEALKPLGEKNVSQKLQCNLSTFYNAYNFPWSFSKGSTMET